MLGFGSKRPAGIDLTCAMTTHRSSRRAQHVVPDQAQGPIPTAQLLQALACQAHKGRTCSDLAHIGTHQNNGSTVSPPTKPGENNGVDMCHLT